MPRRPDVPCATCGNLIWRGSTSSPPGQATCRPCRAKRREKIGAHRSASHTKACIVCDATFAPFRDTHQTCSLSCAQRYRHGTAGPEDSKARERDRWQRKNRRRRALKRNAQSEKYSLAEIAARDRNRCGLCGSRVAMTRTAPHPRAPVVDHVIPLARGGDDVRTNVQLAHFLCNSRKGCHGGGEQLALIG